VSDVPHGTVSKVWYPSETLGMNRRMTVYTPAGYEKGDRSYPVFYLLHGSGGDENAWPELGRATQILDNMIARGEAEPMIVVMTNGNAALQATPGESSAGLVPPTTNLPRMMDGAFELHFPEVVSYIDSNYRTIADKQHRAIGGLSMGGFHSMHISKQFPDMFDYVGLFSAAVTPRNGSDTGVYSDLDGKLARQFGAKPALYWIAIGDKDFLYEENKAYRKYLDDHNYPYIYRESPDGHIWKNWRIYLTEFLPQLFKK
ncbi:MAG: esterase, partial [Muribaculaceae bacterium]|nr:esterase [Muribaculaceae bacterium]